MNADELQARNERRDRMYQGIYRIIKDRCPGCGREFEGRRDKIEGLTVYHKGRCRLFKAWNVITVVQVAPQEAILTGEIPHAREGENNEE